MRCVNVAVPLAFWLLSALMLAHAHAATPDDDTPVAPETPFEAGVIWPSPRMIDGFIDRITEDGIALYGYDELQLEQTRDLLKSRLHPWLERHRSELMPLIVEAAELMVANEPPTPEVMARLSGRALPLLRDFERLMLDVTDDMREHVLKADQLIVLEGQLAAFRVGMGFLHERAEFFADGNFDATLHWPTRNAAAKKISRAQLAELEVQMSAARDAAMGAPPPAPLEASNAASDPLRPRAESARVADEWEFYVEAFVRKYELDADQQSKARTFLKRAQEARDQYKQKKTREMRDLQKQFEDLKTYTGADKPGKLKTAEERYAKLYKPVNDQFERLKERLETLPRAAQRKKAREREAPADGVRATPPAADVSAGKP